ncbi:MAG: NADP-dependent malic enzyme [Gammaproteobacteria bacterium]|nr:NADP-dependent malic enzyme [Gammaproteobacteria bacterium]NNM00323.1 NADP-dependent malic enzyme [Gammaproteobacteria bacterium]
MDDDNRKRALEYHRQPRPGKVEITATKPLANQDDLALAYSPGVAAPCEEIADDPSTAALYTGRGNLVAVISNGTAVLGLGNIGPLAAKPVMEGKGVLFKKFAGIDVFDIEIDEEDPDKLVEIIASLEPTFGGINLEDIKSPECFQVEGKLKQRVNIPVFHDDQHGTAIISAAALTNALKIVNKYIADVRLVCSGAGAAAIACLKLFVDLGLTRENITVCDREGVIYKGRKTGMDPHKRSFALDTPHRTLTDAIAGADIFLGLSGPGVLEPEMVASMADQPIILALANPTPEIMPEAARAVRPDAIIATGRSDYPNQVNNVLCFPYIFRGALDVGATTINEAMKVACVEAIAELTMQESSEIVAAAYGGAALSFGPEYLIPKPFDPRLIISIAPAVAKAAMDSGVATRPLPDIKAYREELTRFVFTSVLLMRPMFEQAKSANRRIVYTDGEVESVLRAVQTISDDGLAWPQLIGRPAVIKKRIEHLGLRLREGRDYECINIESDPRYRDYWQAYFQVMQRRGVSPQDARSTLRTSPTVIAAMMVRRGDADAMLCGMQGRFPEHLYNIESILGRSAGVQQFAAMNVLVLKKGTFFICDTQVSLDPSAEEIAAMTVQAAAQVRRFGITPRAALLSHSNFGTSRHPSAQKMRDALALIRERDPELEVDGEMQAHVALLENVRNQVMPDSTLSGQANLLIMPNLEAANIAMNLLTVLGEGVSVGPILLGSDYSAHILSQSATVRRIINMSALAAVDATARDTEAAP